MIKKRNKENFAILPMDYDTYIFDLYGTLVDIRTDENDEKLWEKIALFYGYYNAIYTAEELKTRYKELTSGKEQALKTSLESDPKYSHEASPEINLLEVFVELFKEKGVEAEDDLAMHIGQAFRVFSTDHLKLYPGVEDMLGSLKKVGKKVYLLSNAQRMFTAYEMNTLDISKYFDAILISSDYQTKKPDKRFFDVLIDEYKIDTGKAIFVGNDSRTDIGGAKQVGLDTFYVKSNISPQGDWAEDATYCVDNFAGYKTSGK